MMDLDGWDLGILIRLERRHSMFPDTFYDLSFINSELISEVGWLKGGSKELLMRLINLVEHGYLEFDLDAGTETRPLFRFIKFPEAKHEEELTTNNGEKE